MNLNDLFTEEKVRLDPKCWTGKKIGNPKTKMKGGVRVNNCVPAESVNEMDKSQTPPGRDGSNDSDASKKEYTATPTTAKKVAKDAEKILNKELNKKQGVAEEASPMIKPPANRFDNKQEAFDYAKEHGGKVFKSTYIDPNTGIKNIIFVVKKEQSVAEDQLDEKSVSQAQFRTMAAAAHNPEFAKKVGIKQSVAKEFHSADKSNNYKKLPDRTTEGEVEKTKTGMIHRSSGAYGGGEAPRAYYDPGKYAKDIDHLDKGLTAKLDKSMGIKWPHGNKKSGMDEGEQQKAADYRDPPEADYGDDYQDMVARVKKLAGLGPLKTVYDPARRVYRNVPTAVQPKK